MVIKDPLSSTSTPSKDDIVSPTSTATTSKAGTGDDNDGDLGGRETVAWDGQPEADGDHLDDQQWDETWGEEEWGEEYWGEEWGEENEKGEGGKEELDGEQLEVEVPAPEPRKLEFGQNDSVVPYEETPDEDVGFAGLFWDPITFEQVELGTMTGHTVGDKGGWTAYYEGFDGHLYCLTRVEDGNGKPP